SGRIGARLGDRAGHHGHAGDEHVVADLDVTDHTHAAGDHAVTTDLGATGNAHAARHGGVIADLHVVRDHDLVVELHAVADQGIGQRAAIYSSICADFHIIADGDAVDLGDLLPDALLVGEAEAFAADQGAGLNHHSLADGHGVIAGHTRRHPAILVDHRARAHRAMGANGHPRSDAPAAFDDGIGA